MPVGLAGAGDDQPGQIGIIGEQLGVGLVVRVFTGLDQHSLQAERRQDVAVGGIAGRGQGNPVAGLERGEKTRVRETPPTSRCVTNISPGSTATP